MCDGGELYSHLQRVGKLSLLEIRSIFSQIINGLIYLHRHRILHRDLSWSNILLSSDKKTIKISDFGIATQIETPDQLHQTMCGTPNFISPEVASHVIFSPISIHVNYNFFSWAKAALLFKKPLPPILFAWCCQILIK